jgi:hypothetical protein
LVLRNTGLNGEPNDNTISYGCKEADWDSARNGGVNVSGKLVVALRGAPAYCDQPSAGARVFRAGAGQKYGAAAVALLNNSAGYPPFEGPIAGNSPTTNPFDPVTIPFFGVQGVSTPTVPSADAAKLIAAVSAAATGALIPNLTFEQVASFSSGGPLQDTSAMKPSLAAPGVSINSTASGTGNKAVRESGTSMATPHIAGVAALVRQAHATWSAQDRRAAILQTADPSLLKSFNMRVGGTGVVQPFNAVGTQAVVFAPDSQMINLSLGEAEMSKNFSQVVELVVVNHGGTPVRFNLSTNQVSGGPATVTFNRSSVFVDAHSQGDFAVTIAVPTTSVGPTHDPNTGALLFQEISGFVTLTPADGSQNNGISLRLPYYLVPRVRSNVTSFSKNPIGPGNPTTTLTIKNNKGAIAGSPDFYSLGNVTAQPSGIKFFDPRAVGVQAIPRSATDNYLVFAINTWTRFNNPAAAEFDICIFTTKPPVPCAPGVTPDFFVLGIQGSVVSASLPADRMVAAVFNPVTGHVLVRFFADAPTDGSTALLAVRASDLGITSAAPAFSYTTTAFNNLDGSGAGLPGTGVFNAFTPALSVAPLGPVAPNAVVQTTVTVNPAQWANTPAAGLMVVVPDNPAGQSQAQIIPAQ